MYVKEYIKDDISKQGSKSEKLTNNKCIDKVVYYLLMLSRHFASERKMLLVDPPQLFEPSKIVHSDKVGRMPPCVAFG